MLLERVQLNESNRENICTTCMYICGMYNMASVEMETPCSIELDSMDLLRRATFFSCNGP